MINLIVKQFFVQCQKIGNPLERDTHHGPQNHKAHLEKLINYCNKAKNEGAELKIGGKRLDQPGYYFEPTVFTGVEDHMFIAQEESFGPVMAITKFSSRYKKKFCIFIEQYIIL